MDLEGGGNIPDDTGDDSDFAVSESPGNAPVEGGNYGELTELQTGPTW